MKSSATSPSERGYTLAALVVILTILAVVVAYSVPPLWSSVMKREREIQTIWVMKQYARAIQEFQRKRGSLPTTLEQLTEQKNPRILRQLYANPLTGELDWILVPAGSPTPAQIITNPAAPGSPQQAPVAQPTIPGGPGSQIGPFIGVRLPNTGESFLELNDSSKYEEWIYTVNELQRDQGPVVVPPVQSVPGT